MYINFQTIRKMLFLGLVGATTLVSCSKEDSNEDSGANRFFIDAGGAESARYMLLADDVTKGEVPLGSNKLQFKPANGYF